MIRKTYKVAAYIRLSSDDGDLNDKKIESNSVVNQRAYIKNFIEKNKEFNNAVYEEYVDDGYTGTNTDRPKFQEMINKAKKGDINCIIVKDFSRFARNHLDAGNYLEYIFPFLGVRFISINDNYDSANSVSIPSVEIGFKNLMNELYSKDISKKIKCSLLRLAEKGKHTGDAVFGYKTSPSDKYKFIIDDEAAKIVRRIFDMKFEGLSYNEISRILNEEGIITPSDYIREKKGKPIQNSSWNLYKVKSIIQNEVYIGNMVLHKTEVDNRGKAKRRKPIITQNTHEAIIDKEIYYEIKNRSNKPGSKCNNINKLFSGKIKCKVCGHNFRGNRGKHTYYFCLFSRGFYDRKCYEKYISEEKMESFVLKELSVYLEKNKDKEKRYKNVSKKDTSYVNSLVKKIEKLKSDKFLLYENYMNEKCSEEKYIKTKREIDIKIESFQNIIESLKENYNEGYKELDLSKIRFNAQESSDRRNDINLIYNELKNIKKLSRDIVDMVIDIILVDSDGSIEIKWKI